MKTVIEIRHIDVQNANAVSGLTWGFPGVSAFLGFVHALDRRLCKDTPFTTVLDGCGIICHSHQTHAAADSYGEYGFALTRNPITKEGKTAPFNEEGRMHLSVTLLVECKVNANDYRDEVTTDPWPDLENDRQWLAKIISDLIPSYRLAGGSIVNQPVVECHGFNVDDAKKASLTRKILMRSLPGFALVDRSDLLAVQHSARRESNPDADMLDAWLDFSAIRSRPSHTDEDQPAKWERVPLPEVGWFVPLVVGMQGIAATQPPDSVASARDPELPFTPVESVYGVGQWLSPHRLKSLEQLLWRYSYKSAQKYHYENRYKSIVETESGV